jgi:hypothetical protein
MNDDAAFERLEDRLLLAGNVNAVLNGSTLVITGDADNNSFDVSGSGGNITITGLASTTINGGASDDFSGVQDVEIRTGAGNDSLGMAANEHTEILGDLTIITGQGNDGASVGNLLNGVTVHGRTVINTGAGNEIVSLEQGTFHGAVVIRTGAGNEIVHLDDSTFMDRVTVDTGRDADVVSISQTKPASTFAGPVVVKLGHGEDGFGAGFSSSASMNNFAGGLSVDGGRGPDTFNSWHSIFPSPPTVKKFETVNIV